MQTAASPQICFLLSEECQVFLFEKTALEIATQNRMEEDLRARLIAFLNRLSYRVMK